MRMRTTCGKRTGWNGLLLAGLVLVAGAAMACMDYTPPPSDLAKAALSDDPATAKAAIDALRGKGPAGLEELMLPYHRLWRNNPRIAAAIDAVAGQKDAAYSGLYWYTDIDQARAAAKAQEKPILSLRLLGNLDSEYSCANSRFFRTTLYANSEVGRALRDRFVLHWKSVRPVPKVTIDMGDGRVICRTVTGNSIHYVLDADGRTIDALPGLYGPKAFLRLLEDAEQVERTLRGYREAPQEQARVLADWHARRLQAIDEAWDQDLQSIGVTTLTPIAGPRTSVPVVPVAKGARTAPTALQAMPRALSKSVVEVKLVAAIDPAARAKSLETSTDDAAWAKIAALPAHAEDARLDGASRLLMRAKLAGRPAAANAAQLATAKRQQEDPVLKVAAKFERSVAEDTVRNEYGFHRKLHEWFAKRLPETVDPAGPDRLNEKVYAELFLTPGSDPWLGLVPEDAYTALERDGLRANAE